MTPNEWIIKGELGTSSKTIWAVMTGIEKKPDTRCDFNYDIPHDHDDFSRCYKLLNIFPEWKNRMSEVAIVFPKWKPLIQNWQYITELYELEKERKDGKLTRTWHLISGLSHACYLADGFTGGNGSYKRSSK